TANGRGIHVANCPGKNTDAVAELALGHLIAADRRIVPATHDLRDGKWRKKEYGKAAGLKGRTLGIVGLGAIGLALAKRAEGLGMKVTAWSRSLTWEKAEKLRIGYCASPEELAGAADAVSVHLAAKPETKHLINKSFLDGLKDNAIFINTSRGEVVDTEALKEAIAAKGLRVGVDVYENEPTGGENTFEQTDLAGIATCTPHIGASTDQAAEAIADEVVRIVTSYEETGKPVNAVNVRAKSSAEITLVVRHFNKVGVLAGVLDELRSDNINIEEMENTVFEGSEAAICTLKLDDRPTEEQLDRIRKDESLIQISLI
ncbi:MAG: hydroxyacid dehydrogenase, partial [bacterium]|nr:hydroxyacid dehydrogenase [bacterium]